MEAGYGYEIPVIDVVDA